MRTVRHGAISGYTGGCRCDECRRANAEYHRRYRLGITGVVDIDREALRDLLHELAPDGPTEECPARREIAASTGDRR